MIRWFEKYEKTIFWFFKSNLLYFNDKQTQMLLNKQNIAKRITEIMPNLNNTFLEDEENAVPDDKASFAKYELKIQHLNDLNKKMYIENLEMKDKIKSLEEENHTLLASHIDQNSIIQRLHQQLENQRHKNVELSKKNEQLLATILLNEQLSVEAKKESNFYVSRYQQKILELRQNLQMKQLQVQSLEEKYEKMKFLQLPMNVKNSNRFTNELLKYQILIDQLIQERNKDCYRTIEEVNRILPQLNRSQEQTKKPKKEKKQKATFTTDIRPNMVVLQDESSYDLMNREKVDVLFLRLHYELRSLKKKYKEKLEEACQLKNKDKVMKQGYNTLTKEMEKIRNKNIQLTIQLEHLEKKLKTAKELSRVQSVGNIPNKRSLQKQNAESRICSQVSIQGNCSVVKNKQKSYFPSQTKYDTFEVTKSHNFDERIENIEGILSVDSNPDFGALLDKKVNHKNDQNEEYLSVCEENSVDMSISLDASGFEAPNKSHHEISENILTGLIDKKFF